MLFVVIVITVVKEW